MGHVRIIGEVAYAMEQGALHCGADRLSAVLKVWPELLAASVALGTSHIHFLKNGKIKTIGHPKESLKAFLQYYLRSNGGLSPLLPDWAETFLRKGPEGFESHIVHEDPFTQWLVPRLHLPSSQQLHEEWGWLKSVFADLIALYPTRTKKGTHEAI